jgi:leucyl/phenylalanyl-tRNA--protein transferase
MPIFRLSGALVFPDPHLAEPEGLLAVGGDLSVERLLLAYRTGIFPWFNRGEPILWWSPPERAVIVPGHAHFSRSLRKTLRKVPFVIRSDTAFASVVQACAGVPRPGQRGTWIGPEMEAAYIALHHAGFAHSIETFLEDELVGGLYGVSLGGCFFGESMFSLRSDASKAAFAALDTTLAARGFDLIDCQLENANVARYGAALISRRKFMELLERSLKRSTEVGKWSL